VLFTSLFGFTGASVEVSDGVVKEVFKETEEEDVGTRVPTVESGIFTNCIASAGENESEVTTSRKAHAGTTVNSLIRYGYLVTAVSIYLQVGSVTHVETEVIGSVQFVRHSDQLIKSK
jgi:hypothetical protein